MNHGGRKEINKGYFGAMRAAKIVVTCNPSHWEGDFRLFEAMVSGALVFVDEMWGPQPFALKHGEHVVVYDTTNQEDFTRKIAYYLSHPSEARRIARNVRDSIQKCIAMHACPHTYATESIKLIALNRTKTW